MKKKNFKIIINVSIVLILFIALIVYMLKVDGIENMLTVIKTVDLKWMIAGLVCMIAYWLIEALCLFEITKKMYKKENFFNTFRISMIGQLFNNITPFSSGGQPMQAYAMAKDGKSISSSATILLIKFIVYQAVLVLFTLGVIVFEYSYFKDLVSNFIDLAIIGFSINFAVIIFLILVGVNKAFVFNIIKHIFKFLGKIKILKKVDEKLSKIEKSVEGFNEKFKAIQKEKWVMLRTSLYTVVQLIAFFGVTYMVYRAFGLNQESFLKIISAQAFLVMIMAFIPIPGAGIAAEGGFLVIFSTFFPQNKITMAVLFWRMLTFYLPIIVGGIFLVLKYDKKTRHEMIDREDDKIEEY